MVLRASGRPEREASHVHKDINSSISLFSACCVPGTGVGAGGMSTGTAILSLVVSGKSQEDAQSQDSDDRAQL